MLPVSLQQTILLVTADPHRRSTLKSTLRACGYRVLVAASALEALLAAARQSGPIDLLAAEPEMPGIDGRGLAEKFRQPFPAVPVLFLGAEPPQAVIERVREALDPIRKQPAVAPGARAAVAV